MKRYLKNPKAALWVAVCLVCLVALGAAVQARADELHLKDGTVIKGLIVSFDATTLKVKTNYGYAVIRRDTVASIVMSGTNSAKPMPKGPDGAPAPGPTDAKNSTAPSATPAPVSSTPAPSGTPATSTPPAGETVAKNEPAESTPAASNAPGRSAPAAKPEPVKTAENKSATTSPSKSATTAATKPAPTPTAPATAAPAPTTTATNKPVSVAAKSNTPTTNAAPGTNAPKPTPVLTPKAEVAENNSKPAIPSNSALPSSIGSTPNGAENPKPASGTHATNTPPPPPLIGTQSAGNSENTGSGVALTRRASKPSSKINQNGFQVESGSSAGYTSTVSGNVDPANPNHENLTPETAPGTAERMPTADDDGQPATPGLRVIPAQPIREYIVANTYINQTYNFKMYRPPEWGLRGSGAQCAAGVDRGAGDGRRENVFAGRERRRRRGHWIWICAARI